MANEDKSLRRKSTGATDSFRFVVTALSYLIAMLAEAGDNAPLSIQSNSLAGHEVIELQVSLCPNLLPTIPVLAA